MIQPNADLETMASYNFPDNSTTFFNRIFKGDRDKLTENIIISSEKKFKKVINLIINFSDLFNEYLGSSAEQYLGDMDIFTTENFDINSSILINIVNYDFSPFKILLQNLNSNDLSDQNFVSNLLKKLGWKERNPFKILYIFKSDKDFSSSDKYYFLLKVSRFFTNLLKFINNTKKNHLQELTKTEVLNVC